MPTDAPPKLLLTFAGSGIKNSKQFNWDGSAVQVNWSYNCSKFGFKGNFIVDFASAGDSFGPDGIVNELGTKGSDSTFEYTLNGDPYHLEVNSECAWSIKVYGLP